MNTIPIGYVIYTGRIVKESDRGTIVEWEIANRTIAASPLDCEDARMRRFTAFQKLAGVLV